MEENVKIELEKFAEYVEHNLGHIITKNRDGNYELLDSFKNGKLLELYLKLRETKIL